jgi:hypothetical protein
MKWVLTCAFIALFTLSTGCGVFFTTHHASTHPSKKAKPVHKGEAKSTNCGPAYYWDGQKCKHKGKGKAKAKGHNK